MKRNVATQIISAVVVSATDGSAITSGVSVTVTGDGGTQGAGGGTVTHEGGGEWSYAPTQAETNFDHVVFKFSGTGAIPVGIQVYTSFPQTGDSFARLGAPAGASASADIAAVKAQTAAIETDTQDIQGRLPAALVSGRIDASVGAFATGQGPRIRKNVALSAFEFVMTDSTNHAPATGKTVTATRSIDGAAFGACANAVAEVASGVYSLNLAAGDLNGDVITLRFTATGCDDRLITVVTNP